jgi:hypothetical protein
MSSGTWLNTDGLFLQFGTAKATPETGGEYRMPGANRVIDVVINLANLPAFGTAGIVSYTEFFPAGQNIYIEAVEVVAEVAMSTASSPTLSVGIIQGDQSTVPSNGATAFVKTAAASTLDTAGKRLYLTNGVAGAGDYVGRYNSQYNTNALTSGSSNSAGAYITATLGTANATGTIRVRIFYHGVSTIPF